MSTKYIQVEVNPSAIDLDPINKTCKISASSIKKEIQINDISTSPSDWSRDNLVKQFGLLTAYPWFWKQSLKDSLNKADDVTPLCKVKPSGYDHAVDIKDLSHFSDIQGGVNAKLKFTHNIEGIIKYASDQKINLQSLASAADPTIPLPEFRRDSANKLRLDCPVRFYKEWTDNGVTKQSDDIGGFYYRESVHKDYAITSDALFVFEAKIPAAIGVNTYNIDKYIQNKSNYIINYTWPPKVTDLVIVTEVELGEDSYGTVEKITGNIFEIKIASSGAKVVIDISVIGQAWTMRTLDFRKNILWDRTANGGKYINIGQSIKTKNITLNVGEVANFRKWKPNSITEEGIDSDGNPVSGTSDPTMSGPGNAWFTGTISQRSSDQTKYSVTVGTPGVINHTLEFGNLPTPPPPVVLVLNNASPPVGTESSYQTTPLNIDNIIYVIRDFIKYMNPENPFFSQFLPNNVGNNDSLTDWAGTNSILIQTHTHTFQSKDYIYYKCKVKGKSSYTAAGGTELKYKYTIQVLTNTGVAGSNNDDNFFEFTNISNDNIVAPRPLGMERGEIISTGQPSDTVSSILSPILTLARVGQQITYSNYYANNKEAYDKKIFYKLYTIYPENHIENKDVTNTITSRKLFTAYSELYPNDALLRPNLVTTNADMQYGDLKRLDVDPVLGNSTPYGYFRLVFKARNIDIPMYLTDKKVSSLTVEQTGDAGTEMYGFMSSLRYVWSPHNAFVFIDTSTNPTTTTTKYHGDKIVTKLMNVYFRHSYNATNPYDFIYGISLKETSTGTLTDLVFPTGLNETKKTKAAETILARAKNYVAFVEPTTSTPTPTGKTANNLYEYYGHVSRGFHHKESYITLFKIPEKNNSYDIPIKKNATNSHIIDNRHVKLAQILIIDKPWTLTSKLINNGIIIIKSGGKLTIDNNAAVSLINHGFVICLSGGEIVDAGNKMKHSAHSSVSKSNIDDVYSESNDVNQLQYHLHSCILPADSHSMYAAFNINYADKADPLATDKSCLFISSNASTFTTPTWDDSQQKFSFDMVAPIIAYSNTLAAPFYNFFIPDFLINKWFNTSRKSIENAISSNDANKGLKLYRKDTNTGQLVVQKLQTDNITNFSMGGLLCKMDIHNVTW